MIWKHWFNLTRNHRRRNKFRKMIATTQARVWEVEFTKSQLWEVRGGMREQYDWLRERVEGAIRRVAEIKYDIHYSESGDLVKVMDLPLPPREIEGLPDKPTPPHRFHKVPKKQIDKEKLEELEKVIKLRQPDLDEQKKNLQTLDAQVAKLDADVAGLHELMKSLWAMLRKV